MVFLGAGYQFQMAQSRHEILIWTSALCYNAVTSNCD